MFLPDETARGTTISAVNGPGGVSQHRLIWAATRSVLEADNFKHRKYGEKRRRHWSLFESLIKLFGLLLKKTPWYRVGYRNATDIVVNRVALSYSDLPDAFDGYTFLHLTDLHLDFVRGMEHTILDRIAGLKVDACMMTGDYRANISGGVKSVFKPMETVVSGIDAADGIFATLGNHDSHMMVEPMEAMGIRMLINESARISRAGHAILLTGLDDPYYYYTDQAIRALEETPPGFKIALVHAPSLFDVAADNGYRLYLSGHTHGGQICLPGGRPIILHLRHGRRYYRGLWEYNGMKGYTGQGTGTVALPIRFNTRSEITVITLNKTIG